MLKLVTVLTISAIASVAHSQEQLNYTGNEMSGDSFGNISASFQITGNTVDYDVNVFGENKFDEGFSDSFVGVSCLTAQNCTPSQSGPTPFTFELSPNNNAPPSFNVAETFAPNSLLTASVGPNGDALSVIEGGGTALSVTNMTPGSWTLNGSPLLAAPELDPGQRTVAMTLLVGGLLVLGSRRRATGSRNG